MTEYKKHRKRIIKHVFTNALASFAAEFVAWVVICSICGIIANESARNMFASRVYILLCMAAGSTAFAIYDGNKKICKAKYHMERADLSESDSEN